MITVGSPRDELDRFWRELATLPRVAPRLREVTVLDSRRSRWLVDGPGGARLEWESEITDDQPGESIGWRTTSWQTLTHFGTVRFSPAASQPSRSCWLSGAN